MTKKITIIVLLIVFAAQVNAQNTSVHKPVAEDFKAFNRTVNITETNGHTVIHLDAKEGDGVAWIKNAQFSTGLIEFDVKGKNVMQQSFVGIAFHGINDSSFEAIYFRPFNFQAEDATRKAHSVQYIHMPEYDWSYLREKFPGKYENNLTQSIDADAWFHAKVVVEKDKVEVFVNHDKQASLTVKPIGNITDGSIGFWTGNNSDGDFSGLMIIGK